jgi:hypothetical protein
MLLKLVGMFSLDDVQAITVLQEQILAQYGRLFVIADLHEASGFSPEGRKFLVEWSRRHTINAIAQYGVGLVSQTMSTLVAGAIRILGGRVPPIKNAKDEDEARAFIAAEKRKLGTPTPG